jgi:FlaA1/EpsC-like NDP-sugar epimerase
LLEMAVRLSAGRLSDREEWGRELVSLGQAYRAWAGGAFRIEARCAAKLAIDTVLMSAAAGWAWMVSFGQMPGLSSPLPFIALVLCARIPIYVWFSVYRMPWRKVSRHDVMWLAASAGAGVVAIAFLLSVLPDPFALRDAARPYLLLATEPALYLVLLGGLRIAVRSAASRHRQNGHGRATIVVGTGDAARSLAWQLQESITEYRVVGFVDDDPSKQALRILGKSVLGTTEDLVKLVHEMEVEQIVVAIPSLSAARLREILRACEKSGAQVRILPPLRELMHSGVRVGALREVQVEDLLPRSEVQLDHAAIARYLRGRTVLVTGGGGSIGRELCRQILKTGAARLLVLGRGENSVYEAVQELSDIKGECEVIPVICDVQNLIGLRHVFELYAPEVVFHAAAHKHVPLMERYPAEAVRNNIVGTLNVVRLSVQFMVKRFVLVSTDKAVEPSSVMGTSKRVAEMIVKAHALARDANMVSVRFGNVLGSRGSVVPSMTRQIRKGLPVTVTDPEMVRYFMTVSEAVQLVLQAGAVGGRGEVFVLDMGYPVRIMDLAHDLIRLSGLVPNQDVPIRVTGRRPGEKLREDFLSKLEAAGAQKTGQFYIAPAEGIMLDALLEQIQALRSAAAESDGEKIVSLLHEIVPAFRPDAVHVTPMGRMLPPAAAAMGRPE